MDDPPATQTVMRRRRRFGAQLRRLRVQARLSFRQLAGGLHRAHSSIVGYESGRRLPLVEVVEQYEDYFGLTRGTLGAQRERARVARLEVSARRDPRRAPRRPRLPYMGLRAFEYDDAALVYGREAQAKASWATVTGALRRGRRRVGKRKVLVRVRGAARRHQRDVRQRCHELEHGRADARSASRRRPR